MVLRIQQDDKIHSFLEGIGLRPLARREAVQSLTRVMERNQEMAASERSLMQVAYQKARNQSPFQIEIWPTKLLMATDLCILLPFWEHLKSKEPW